MPVRRVDGHPNMRVFVNAGVVVNAGLLYVEPILTGFDQGGWGETREFGMAFFRNINWNGRVEVLVRHDVWVFIDTPLGQVSLIHYPNCSMLGQTE